MFSRIFEAKKKNAQRGLVLNLVKISKDFLIFISILLKTAETRFDSEPVSNFSIKTFFGEVCVPHLHVNTLNYALISIQL